MTKGAIFSASGTPRSIARESSSVRSFAAAPTPGMPVVSVFPGTTISRFEPMFVNWSTT
jgi:hypothetical protein